MEKRFDEMERGFDLPQALAEADRCLLCYDAPCSQGCPAETDPGTFIRKLRLRNVTGAIRTIKENNILGGACGVLCPTPKLCERGCSATGIGRAIEIGKIQRALIEHSWNIEFQVFERGKGNREKVAVVGSGPAGSSCAAELAKFGYRVTVFEARAEAGGVIRYGVPPYRFDKRFLDHELEDLRKLGVEFKCSRPVEGHEGTEKLLSSGFKAVFLAPGLWDSVALKPGENEIEGLFDSVEYLAALREDPEGISATVKGRTVAVIGGGSVAMDCVESAARMGAADVYLVYRRSYAQMPAEEDERISCQNAGAHFLLLNQPVDYITDGPNRIRGLKCVRTRLGEPDDSGRRRPVEIEGSEWTLETDVVIVAIGNKAPEGSPEWYPQVKLRTKNLIAVDPETGATSVKGIFAGDLIKEVAPHVGGSGGGKKDSAQAGGTNPAGFTEGAKALNSVLASR